MAELVLLSIIQGITEFLPVSSSAHLIIISKYFNFSNSNLTLDVSLHFGSLLAIILYFKKDLKNFFKNNNLLKKIIILSLPVIIAGFFLIKLDLIDYLRSYEIIGWATIVFAIILHLSDLRNNKKTIKKNLTVKNVIIIGLSQILSLIPGVSRSGIVITSARFLNFSRVESARISFLTSIPVLALISGYNLYKIYLEKSINISITNLSGVLLSFIFSYLTILMFVNFLKKFNLQLFVIYRIILGVMILTYVYK